MTRFDLIYLAATPVIAPVLAYKALTRGKYRESAPGMLGWNLAEAEGGRWKDGSVWVHAVSVGEVVAAQAMLPLLRGQFRGLPVVVTTATETGQARARALVPELADAAHYCPVDLSWKIGRFADVFHPRVLVLMETELWPNMLRIISDRGVPIFVLNAKISERSFSRYVRFRQLLRDPLSRVSAFCAQTDKDAARLREMCGDSERVFVTGNCKFDIAGQELTAEARRGLRDECGLTNSDRVIVVGSTHSGEEEIVLRAFAEIQVAHPDTVLLLAPRHPERFNEAWDLITKSGLPVRRMSETSDFNAARIVLVDRMGLLSRLYAIGEVAVVGGSFVAGIGGHNVLEPASHGVPVVYGPYMEKQPDMVRILGENAAGTTASADMLGGTLLELLHNREDASRKGLLGRDAVVRNRGAARRNMEIISRCIGARL